MPMYSCLVVCLFIWQATDQIVKPQFDLQTRKV